MRYHFKHNIAVVIPTRGRSTLVRCLDSLMAKNQNGYGAETIVVYDTHGTSPPNDMNFSDVQALCDKYYVTLIAHDAGYSDWGYPQLEHGYKNVLWSEYIMNIGDDDVMIEGILPKMVDIINRIGISPYMFQAELHPSPHRGNTEPVILWNDSDRSLSRQTITGQNLLVPNVPHMFGQMTDDCEFIQQTIKNWGLVHWIPIVIARCY